MVKSADAAKTTDAPMLIAQFSKQCGLPADTIRFYIRKGLLKPSLSAMGGSRPYQIFRSKYVRIAERIRTGQALGLSLDEIGALVRESESGKFTRERSKQFLRQHRQVLHERCEHLRRLVCFLDAKVAWLDGSRDEPLLETFLEKRSAD
jgi:MerR family transcriptional regulator, copper efflux regulator